MEQHELGDFLARFSAGVGNQPEADMTMLQRLEVALQRAASAVPDGKPYWMARAALEAMREPTDWMVNRGGAVLYHGRHVPDATSDGVAAETYAAMIDAALEKQPS